MVVVVFLSLWMRAIWVGIRSVNLQYDGVFLSMFWLRVICVRMRMVNLQFS